METALSQTKPQQAVFLPKVNNGKETLQKIVTISANGKEFGVDTKLIRNVIQIADASLVDDGEVMILSGEKIPVFPLQGLIDDTIAPSALDCLLYTSPSPRDATLSRMPSSA